ncbi:hypothetical protein SDC9_203782 [bioreactor metagenome]|uniref:Uncharacterized protein n=1 Tax=bioreactor metagenome TaxID=1076179 RepID=A0A645IY37_9ZZZZ
MLQVLQIPGSYPQNDIQNELRLQSGLHILDNALGKFGYDGVFPQRYRYDIILRDEDTHRYRIIGHARFGLFRDRRVDDNQGSPVLGFDAGGFLFVQSGTEEVGF